MCRSFFEFSDHIATIMTNLSLCRVCLASNTKMQHIANTRYQEIFEKLSTKLCTEDGRPKTICYLCYAQLQKCCHFMDMSRKAEAILTQFSQSGVQLTEDTISILDRKFVYKLTWTPLQFLSVNTKEDKNVNLKKECADTTNVKVESASNQMVEQNVEKFDQIPNVKIEPLNNEITEDELIVETIRQHNIVAEFQEIPEFINTDSCQRDVTVKQEIESEEVSEDQSRVDVKREVKQEVEESSLDAEVEQEDASQDNFYEEISITNLEPRQRYACSKCDKTYAQKCHLSRHTKAHRVKEYICEICGMSFFHKCTLKKHYFTHTKERNFACELCPTRCTQRIDLERHMRKHTGQKPFTCDICQQTFSRKSNMKLHILTHYDTKPFVCHVCNSSFSRRYDLNRHRKRKHTGEKPHACDFCNFRSVNASYVKTHIENKHWEEQGLKPFCCDECDFKCGNASYLKIHVQKKHACDTQSNLTKKKQKS